MNRRMLWIVIALVVILVPVIAVVTKIDNWQRDLTTNEAETSEAATDPLLRPLDFQGEREQLVDIVMQAASELPRWEFVEQSSEGETIVLHLTRSTALFGFVDDIHVTLEPRDGHVRLSAHSKSRIGKGDLGQNPRNLKELMGAILERSGGRVE